MINTKMIADDENDHLWHYLNRVSLQLITWLDLDRAQTRLPTTKMANSDSETESALKSKRDIKHTGTRLDSRALENKQQAAGKIARTRRNQQQRHAKRSKRQQQQLEDPNATVTPPDSLFSDQFKRIEDEKQSANEQQQQQPTSSCVLNSDQTSHEHYIPATDFNPHHNHLTTADNVVESIIQMDSHGNSNLSSVGLLTLAIPDDNLCGQHHHHQHHHHQQLEPNHSAASIQSGGNELLASPTPIRLSPADPTVVQLGGNSNRLAPVPGNYYTVSSLAYDDFVGHHHHYHQNGTPAAQHANIQSDSATDHQTSPSNQYQQTGEPLTDCYLHHGHLHQHDPAAVHHQHYQHNHFDHQAAASHHELQQQQQQQQQQQHQPLWLNQPPIISCSDSSTQAALNQQLPDLHHHNHHAHRQPVDPHDIDYSSNPSQTYQQQLYSSRGPNLVEHHHNHHLHHQHHVNEQHHHQSHHNHEHQIHNGDNSSTNTNNQHHLASQQQHMTPPLYHLQAGHNYHHHGHLIPSLGPLVNGIECSSVILHDINLASASWSSPEDLYSI